MEVKRSRVEKTKMNPKIKQSRRVWRPVSVRCFQCGIVRAYLQAFAQGAAPVPPAPEADRENREKLVRLLSECRLELGYKPSRAKTYEGGRFSRSTEDLNAGQI